MSEFRELTNLVNAFRDERDWRQFHNPKDFALSISLEAAELLEHFQWKNGSQVDAYLKNGGLGKVQNEMADILVYLAMMADDLGIDLLDAVKTKLELQAAKYPAEKARGTATKYTRIA